MGRVAHIQMPEGGLLQCLMPEQGGGLLLGDPCLCELDYGQDVGRLVRIGEAPADDAGITFRALRKLSADDAAVVEANAALAQKARHVFQLSVRYEKAAVKVLHARFSFNRERLFIRYSAAAAVDLRRFLSQIQRDYKTQVNLWQVNPREAVMFVGCMGVCGREACCCSWQRCCPNPSTRMAKAQDLPLNPATANGRCGWLKCCLAFEYEQYRQEGQDLPSPGHVVRCLLETREADVTVIDRDVLRGRLTVRTREGRTHKLLKEDVLMVRKAAPDNHPKGDANEDSVGEWAEP